MTSYYNIKIEQEMKLKTSPITASGISTCYSILQHRASVHKNEHCHFLQQL